MQQQSTIHLRPVVALLLFICQLVSITEAKENISNDWTLPQEGFSVFYRFFRDKISWFEADAVCQFHHGNLVTVNNGLQFDSTRAFLRELDVSDTVWIGLKGSAGSSQFTWANSQPLDNNAGYWAESFPATENPLCAAMDPTKGFRWHALDCNGPSTAAFLCELPVPDWGSHCTSTGMPSVTIQYLSDASIRLSRDCGDEEGERHVLCRAGQDRATVLSQLVCNNVASSATPTSTEGTPASDEDAAINKIVTEIQSIATNDTLNGELEPLKPRKQPKKFNPLDKKKVKRVFLEKEAKMGKKVSQAEHSLTADRTAPTEILPRSKKMREEDLRPMEGEKKEERVRRETLTMPSSTADEMEVYVATTGNSIDEEALTLSNYTTEDYSVSPTPEDESFDWTSEGVNNVTEPDIESTSSAPDTTEALTTTTNQPVILKVSATTTRSEPQATQRPITHPIHVASDTLKEVEGPPKKQVANQQDHFIPPMLLVKAKFTSPVDAQHTIETPLQETTINDISKFYPASTEKTISEGNKILVEIPEHNSTLDAVATSTSSHLPLPVASQTANTEAAASVSASPETPKEAETQKSEFSFNNVENYQPYRPNRRRALTKPASHSYLRRILG